MIHYGQEADWAKNQNLIADRFEQAKAKGKFGKGTVARVAGERASETGPSPTTHNPSGGK